MQRSVPGVYIGDLMEADGTYLDSQQRHSKKFNFLTMLQRGLQTSFNSDSDFLCSFRFISFYFTFN